MRKLKYYVAASVDSFIARADGSVDWLERGGKEDYGMKEFYATLDTVLIGRKTHDFMVSMKMESYPKVTNYVFSRSKPAGKRGKVEFVSQNASAFVADLKKRPGKDIWLVGGSLLAQELFQHRLVDEIAVHFCPVLLGEGIQLFQGPYPESNLQLLSCKAYASGFVGITYSVK
ncbi:MAG TPA: dihydrofolate reductase family protein [Candidatus Angelobacter sp.]